MPYGSNDLRGSLADQFKVFCQHVDKVRETPNLINLVAGESVYIGFCRDIIGGDKGYQRKFIAFCRNNRLDGDTIRERLGTVAAVLGIGKHLNYYKLLGVNADANEQAIKKAYRKKAKQIHPDNVHSDKATSDDFVELHAAYVHLSDPELRKIYDQSDEGQAKWVEGPDVFNSPGQGMGAGRFFSWLCVLVGALVCLMYLLDTYNTGMISFSTKQPGDELLEEANIKYRTSLAKIIKRPGGPALKSPSQKEGANPDETKVAISRPGIDSPTQTGRHSDNESIELFYNPRREKRYWASANSMHDSVEGAMDALAAIYGRTPEWVNKHMGSENKLSAIHRRLIEQQAIEHIAAMKEEEKTASQGRLPEPVQKAVARSVAMPEKTPKVAAVSLPKMKTPIAAKDKKVVEKKATKVVSPASIKKIAPVNLIPPQAKKKTPRKEKVAAKRPVKAVVTTPTKKRVPDKATSVPVNNSAPVKTRSPSTKMVTSGPKSATVPGSEDMLVMQNKRSTVETEQQEKQRILAFLKKYTIAYEQKDIGQFEKFFTQDAIEMGKPFKTLLPTYDKTFKRVDALNYDIEMKAFTSDNIAKAIHLNGVFAAEYRLPEKEWIRRSGSIRMELFDSEAGLLVKRLEYEMDR